MNRWRHGRARPTTRPVSGQGADSSRGESIAARPPHSSRRSRSGKFAGGWGGESSRLEYSPSPRVTWDVGPSEPPALGVPPEDELTRLLLDHSKRRRDGQNVVFERPVSERIPHPQEARGLRFPWAPREQQVHVRDAPVLSLRELAGGREEPVGSGSRRHGPVGRVDGDPGAPVYRFLRLVDRADGVVHADRDHERRVSQDVFPAPAVRSPETQGKCSAHHHATAT